MMSMRVQVLFSLMDNIAQLLWYLFSSIHKCVSALSLLIILLDSGAYASARPDWHSRYRIFRTKVATEYKSHAHKMCHFVRKINTFSRTVV